METEMIEKCMLQPVNPLMVGQSQAIPKKLPLMAASGALKQYHSIPLNYLPASTYSLGYAPFQHNLGKRDAGDLQEFFNHLELSMLTSKSTATCSPMISGPCRTSLLLTTLLTQSGEQRCPQCLMTVLIWLSP